MSQLDIADYLHQYGEVLGARCRFWAFNDAPIWNDLMPSTPALVEAMNDAGWRFIEYERGEDAPMAEHCRPARLWFERKKNRVGQE